MLPATHQYLVARIAGAINERMQRNLDYTGQMARLPVARASVEWSTSTTARLHEPRRCLSGQYGFLRLMRQILKYAYRISFFPPALASSVAAVHVREE